jgi:hypothetical protein
MSDTCPTLCRLGHAAHRIPAETKMSNHYQHTQPGTLMIVVLVVGAIVCAAIAYGDTGASRGIAGAVAAGLLILAWLFSSLTVIVDDSEVRWYFGPGAWSYRTALADIASARPVRNSWVNGFGIRMGPGFRLYNVSGLDAVELKLKDGNIRRIGTDDPAGLAAALQRE